MTAKENLEPETLSQPGWEQGDFVSEPQAEEAERA